MADVSLGKKVEPVPGRETVAQLCAAHLLLSGAEAHIRARYILRVHPMFSFPSKQAILPLHHVFQR